MMKFEAVLDIIGINPFVFVPEPVLISLLERAGRSKGPIPVKGKINKTAYTQTLVRFKGEWRLYINTVMLKNSPERIGETLKISIQNDKRERTLEPDAGLVKALNKNKRAKRVFDELSPYLQKEIIRYISALKTEETRKKNIEKAIGFLCGKNRFIGRDAPQNEK